MFDTVDSICSTFTKTVQRLGARAEKCRAVATYNEQLAREYGTAAEAHTAEAAKAERIAAKINKLLEE